MFTRHATSLVAGLLLAAGASAAPAPVEVIYTNLQDDPSSLIPGTAGERFRAPLAPFLDLKHSPSGNYWIFKAFSDNPDSDANDVMIIGSGGEGLAGPHEGDPAPLDSLTYGFMDSDCGINDSGQYAFGNRLSGGSTATDEIIFKFDGTDFVVVAREGDLAPGLFDSGPVGDEVFGNSLNSAHIMNTGVVGYRAQIENIASDFDIALYHDLTVVAQTNVASKLAGFDGFAAGTFDADIDGENWIVEGDSDPGTGTTDTVVLNGAAIFQEGDTIGDFTSPVAAIFYLEIGCNEEWWFVRGDNADDVGWVVRNGEVIAATGDPIVPDSDEHYAATSFGATFATVRSNSLGDHIICGSTDNDDPARDQVIVMNGETVLARKGDPIDLNGDSMDNDDLYIAGFHAYDAFLTNEGDLYFFADMRNANGDDMGDAFLRVRPGAFCPEDLNGDGVVNQQDLGELLGSYGQDDGGDIDGDGDTDQADLGALLSKYGEPCP